MKKYFAKPHTHFDEEMEVILIQKYNGYGFFEGYRYGKIEQAMCPFDEFYIKEEDDNYTIRNRR